MIGDGGCFFEIVDIAVLPEYQKKGVGRQIMDGLMEYTHFNALPTAYVSLMADHGTPEFYKILDSNVLNYQKAPVCFYE